MIERDQAVSHWQALERQGKVIEALADLLDRLEYGRTLGSNRTHLVLGDLGLTVSRRVARAVWSMRKRRAEADEVPPWS